MLPMELYLPPPPGVQDAPEWTGSAFQIGEGSSRILTYDVQADGWSDDLNHMLDEHGGEDHFMSVASRQNTIRALGKWLTRPRPRIIEIGCASGYALQSMHRAFSGGMIIGADPFAEVLNNVAQKLPDVPLLQFDLLKCPLPDRFVDAVVLLNVLEHIEDENTALRHLFRIVRPGGIACIEVPAGPNLYDLYDRTLRHHRRYSMQALTATLEKTGFEILERSHLGFFVFPAFWVVKKRNRKYNALSPEEQKARVLQNIKGAGNNTLLHWLMATENWLRRKIYLPWGIRCFVVCRRNAD
jgi:ubiquinone/menaquinone biosynthesis C-methylase UbiE